MAIVERNNGGTFNICNDAIDAYAGPGTRIYGSMREYRTAKGIQSPVIGSAMDLVRPASRVVSADHQGQVSTMRANR